MKNLGQIFKCNSIGQFFLRLIAFLLLAGSPLSAQSPQITEGFESGLPSSGAATPTVYTLTSGQWTGFQAQYATTSGRIGNYALQLKTAVNAYIHTPALSSVGTLVFTCKSGTSNEVFKVQKSTDSTNWTDISTITLPVASTWYPQTITVNDATQHLYIRILNSGSFSLYIDGLTITATAPTTQLSGISFSSVTSSGMILSWTNGNGGRRAVFVKETAGTASNPVNGTAYTASSDWSAKGTQLGTSGYYCVYDGTGTTVTLSNLAASTAYYVQGYEYNGKPDSSQAYYTASATNNPNNTTTLAAGVPTMPVSTNSIASFGNVVTGTTSSEASYTVSGTNLTASITITPPSGFQVSTTSGSGFGSSVVLPAPGGTVSSTTVYVRFAPGTASGSTSGNITNVSGSLTENIAVSGVAIAEEPATQPTLTPSNQSYYSIDLSFTGGNGSRRVVVARIASAVTFTPSDAVAATGVNSNFSTATDQGSGNKIVYDGTGTTVTVTGLPQGTTVHFAAYEYNQGTNNSHNYLTTAPGTASLATNTQAFTWNGGTTDYTVSANWTPTRYLSGSADVLHFNSGTTVTVTNIPTETVGQITVSGNTTVNLQATGTTLTISGGTGTDLDVAAGSALNINGTNPLRISMATGTTGIVNGSMVFSGAAHTFSAVDTGTVNFNSGAVFTQAAGCTGNVFLTSGTAGIVNFNAGAVFISQDGANPFGLSAPATRVNFRTGSTYRHEQNATPSISNRTYANFDYNYNGVVTISTASNPFTVDNLTISQGRLRFTNAGVINITAAGNLTVAAGATVQFNNGGGVVFAATGSRTINGTLGHNTTFTNLGTLVYGAASTLEYSAATAQVTADAEFPASGGPANLTLANAAGVTLHAARTVTGMLTLGGNNTYTNLTNITGYSGLTYSATVAQITGAEFGASITNLTINNAAGVTLAESKTVTGTFTLSSGILSIGSYNLTLGPSAVFSGTGSASTMVAATGTGELRKEFSAPGSFTFGVGNADAPAAYTPVTVSVLSYSAATSAYVAARLVRAKHPSNNSTGTYLNRYWVLSSSGFTNPKFNAAGTYASADLTGSASQLYGGQYSGSAWVVGTTADSVTHVVAVDSLSALHHLTGGEYDYVGGAAYLNLTLLFEGYYDLTKLSLSDTVTVLLANATAPYAFVDTCRGVIDSLNFTGSFKFRTAPTGTYYLVVRHRNALESWSKSGGEVITKGASAVYDFSADQSNTFGGNAILKGSKWCIYSGDVNQDGLVDLNDLIAIDNDNANFEYHIENDLNMDWIVDLNDMIVADNNNAGFVAKVTPGKRLGKPAGQNNLPKTATEQ